MVTAPMVSKRRKILKIYFAFRIYERLFQIIFGDALLLQLLNHIRQIIGIWISVTGMVRSQLRFMVDFVPSDCIVRTSGDRATDREN